MLKKIPMSDTNLAPLFTYLDDKFVSQNKRFDALDEKFQTFQTSVDGLSKLVKDYQDEHILLRRKVEMLEAGQNKYPQK